jgi:hypothetical protein
MKKFLPLIFLTLIILSFPVFAAEDYSNVKGDFKIFCLGESYETGVAKFNYLKNTNQLIEDKDNICEAPDDKGNGGLINLETTVFDQQSSCTLGYIKNKLYRIYIIIDDEDIKQLDTSLKYFVFEHLIPSFNSLYGQPSIQNPYPTAEQMMQNNPHKNNYKEELTFYDSEYQLLVWENDQKSRISVSLAYVFYDNSNLQPFANLRITIDSKNANIQSQNDFHK